MSWWDFGLMFGLALQALLLWRIARVFAQLRAEDQNRERDNFRLLAQAIDGLRPRVEDAVRQSSKACEGVKMLGAIDIGVLRDAGWLILASRHEGRDWVKIQELSPMTMLQYREMCRRLEDLGTEFRYVDGPIGARDFIRDRRRG